MYKVIHLFTDLQDGDCLYEVGDVYPREGKEVSEARLAELAGSDNKQGKPLIEKVAEEEVSSPDVLDAQPEVEVSELVEDAEAPEEKPETKKTKKTGSKAKTKSSKKEA